MSVLIFRSVRNFGPKQYHTSLNFVSVAGDRRWFSVKELPWCAPNDSPTRRTRSEATTIKRSDSPNENNETTSLKDKLEPIARFGIVAAASNNRVIGVNGEIPWPRIAEDRKIFKDLTRDKILIVGRRTFEEEPNQLHINHSRHCIVVSTTMNTTNLVDGLNDSDGAVDLDHDDDRCATRVHVAGSFDEALHLAKSITETNKSSGEEEINHQKGQELECWIAGGERIYEEALRHPSAQELHLTIVDTEVDLWTISAGDLARFPPKYRWDQKFKQISQKESPKQEKASTPGFSYFVYERKRRT